MSAPEIPHVNPALARKAVEHFQCLYAEPQTDDDGHEMATNTLGVFEVWRDWQRRREAASTIPAPAPRRKHRRRESSPSTQE